MKKKNIFILGFIVVFLALLVSCSTNEIGRHDDLARVTFELEGGSYKSSQTPVKHFYDLKGSDSTLIYELTDATGSKLTRPEYELVGWYKDKIVNGDKVSYENEWNFATDKLTKEGVTLYAYWKKQIVFAFNVCYKDEKNNNEVVVLGSYAVDPDEPETKVFSDRVKHANKRDGYTALSYIDENGAPWDFNFVHPCDPENPVVNVYCEYIEGEYIIARTASDLIDAANNNIYLMNDIDMDGSTLTFGDYKYILEGNGYKISNFIVPITGRRNELKPDLVMPEEKSLYVSLFGNMENAKVRNVTFENVSVTISTTFSEIFKIYVSPLAITLNNSILENVNYSGEVKVTNLPETFITIVGEEKNINSEKFLVCESGICFKLENSEFKSVSTKMDITNSLKK